ncbi:MAG: EAL domain-containing protein [Azoarcus sp.]|nr:EAL domain-containing protein [Azoarcus sp.]
MHFLFKPIVALLDRLRYPWKFAFIGVIFLLGLIVLFGQMHTSVSREVAHTQRQIAGLELVDKMFSVLVTSQQHRGYSSGFLGGDQAMGARVVSQAEALTESIARLDAELSVRPDWAVLASRWSDIRLRLKAVIAHGLSLSAPDNFHVHTEAIELILVRIGDVGEVSGLAGNSDPRIANLVAPMLRTMPLLTEGLGRLRGYATGNLARANVGMQDEYALATQLAALAAGESALKDRLRRAALSNTALTGSLETAMGEIEASIDQLRYVAQSEVLSRSFTIAPTKLFNTGTVAIDTVLKHYRETLRPSAEALLNEHLYTLRVTMASSLLIMVAITLIATYLFGGIYFSIRRSVRELTHGAQQFADGHFGARVSLSARDELQQVADRFNAMAHGIAELLSGQHQSSRRLDDLLKHNPSAIFALSPDTLQYNFVSPNAQVLFGRPPDEMLACDQGWHGSVHDHDREHALMAFTRWSCDDFSGVLQHVCRLQRKDEIPTWVDVRLSAIRDDAGKAVELVGSCTDISERQQTQTSLELAASVFSHAREGITITDAEGSILDVNHAFTRITGYSREEVLGKNPRILKSGRQDQTFYAAMWNRLTKQGFWEGELWNRRKSGEIYAESLTISTVCRADGKVSHYVAVFMDITRQKVLEKQLKQIAHFDALTGLPNRVLFADRLTQAMARARRTELPLALVYIDLDGFKAVNDAHGHAAGDRLLITLAQRMKDCLRAGDTIARLGGDEFAAVLSDLKGQAATQTLIQRLLAAIALPVQVDDLVVNVSGSVGLTFYPQRESIDADQLLRQADQAMYQAKLAGKNRFNVFDIEQNTNLRDRNERRERIRDAFEQRQFELHYQPKVNMRTGEIVGAEALIRWRHPEHGLLPPATFLPVIENHQLEIDIGQWVIDTTLAQMETWLDGGLNLPVSVNIAGHHMQQADFVDVLQTLLDAHPRVPRHYLELEVLESSALEDIAHVSSVIEACGRIGVGVALDDFGTGYSSLTYLKRLPAGVIKIDRGFVCDMLYDPDDLAILEGVLGLARSFQRQAIAEGVETVAHGQLLLQLGCELAQGYGIARPMPADEIPHWIANWRPKPAWTQARRVPPEMLAVLYAAVEHRGWVKRVETCLSRTYDHPPALAANTQRFGQWFDALAMQEDRHPRLPQINALHLQAHALGSELMALNAADKAEAARARLPELLALRDQLLSALAGLIEQPGDLK